MDFIEEFFKNNRDLFFSNSTYSEKDLVEICSNYYGKLEAELANCEKETQRLHCSELWKEKGENDGVWEDIFERLSNEQYIAVCNEEDCHNRLANFRRYTRDSNLYTNPRVEQLRCVFNPFAAIKENDTILKIILKVVFFWLYWPMSVSSAEKRCHLSNCEKLLKGIGYFNKNN